MPYDPELALACLYANQHESNAYFDPYRDAPYERSRPAKHPFQKNNKDKDVAIVLDALAECSMYEARHHSVSISLTVTVTNATLYVAQVGGSMDVVVGHLHGIMAHLRRIRESISSPVPPEHRSQRGFDLRLAREFGFFLTKFSIDKLRWRILKHIDTFLNDYLPKVPGGIPAIPQEDLQAFTADLRDIRARLPHQGPVGDSDIVWLMERTKDWQLRWRRKPRGAMIRNMPEFIDICGTFLFGLSAGSRRANALPQPNRHSLSSDTCRRFSSVGTTTSTSWVFYIPDTSLFS